MAPPKAVLPGMTDRRMEGETICALIPWPHNSTTTASVGMGNKYPCANLGWRALASRIIVYQQGLSIRPANVCSHSPRPNRRLSVGFKLRDLLFSGAQVAHQLQQHIPALNGLPDRIRSDNFRAVSSAVFRLADSTFPWARGRNQRRTWGSALCPSRCADALWAGSRSRTLCTWY
jgi:hypothetical protein